MPDYDEIDQFVDSLFRSHDQAGGGSEPLHGEVLSGDWRIDRIDEIIEDAYNEAIWWHNNRISEGCDPRSGLRSLPYVPWDENIDGVAAMQGAIGNVGARPGQHGQRGPVVYVDDPRSHLAQTGGGGREGGGGCLIVAALGILALTIIWAMTVM